MSQPPKNVYREKKIRFDGVETSKPIFYLYNDHITKFDSKDIFTNQEALLPVQKRYDSLSQERDTVWIKDVAQKEVHDSVALWQRILIEDRMFHLYKEGEVEVYAQDRKALKKAIMYREEQLPIIGTNYFFAVKQNGVRVFEYFDIFWGCPAF